MRFHRYEDNNVCFHFCNVCENYWLVKGNVLITLLERISHLSCQVDLSSAMAYIMASKEESELNTIKKACQATMDLYNKYTKSQIMDIIDKDKVSSDIYH